MLTRRGLLAITGAVSAGVLFRPSIVRAMQAEANPQLRSYVRKPWYWVADRSFMDRLMPLTFALATKADRERLLEQLHPYQERIIITALPRFAASPASGQPGQFTTQLANCADEGRDTTSLYEEFQSKNADEWQSSHPSNVISAFRSLQIAVYFLLNPQPCNDNLHDAVSKAMKLIRLPWDDEDYRQLLAEHERILREYVSQA